MVQGRVLVKEDEDGQMKRGVVVGQKFHDFLNLYKSVYTVGVLGFATHVGSC